MESHFHFLSWQNCNAGRVRTKQHALICYYTNCSELHTQKKKEERQELSEMTEYTYSVPNCSTQRLCWKELKKQNSSIKMDLTYSKLVIKDFLLQIE